MSRPHDPTRGAALPLAIVVLLAVSALVAELATAGRTALRIAVARRDTTEALAAADGCLARAVHALPPGWDFDAPLRGRDDIANTADDGVLDAPPGCIALLAAAPGGGAPSRALASVVAETPRARRRLGAVIRRALTAGAGTLIWATDPTALGLPSGSLDLDGVDHGVPAHEPLGLIGAPNEPSELDAWATTLGAHLIVAPGTAPPISRAPPPLVDLIGRTRLVATGSLAALTASQPAPVALSFASGDLVLPGSVYGQGLLVVDGVLDVPGTFDFRGVVVARSGLRLHAGAVAQIHGELWLGAPPVGPAPDLAGRLRIDRDDGAVVAADALLPLPRLAVIGGVLDAS